MLTQFSIPYPDELLYSLCARYTRLMGHGNRKLTLEHLFGRTTVTAVFDLPTHLSTLAEHLAPLGGPTASELIDQFTLFPYHAGFHPPERRAQVRAAMGGDGHPHWLLGLISSGVQAPRRLRSCPMCVDQERRQYGEAYWHRLHQLPGVLICEKHAVWLEDSAVVAPAPVTRHAFLTAEEVVPHGIQGRAVTQGTELDVLMDLALRSRALLNEPPLDVPTPALRGQYLQDLATLGLATFSGRLRLDSLQQAFSAFCPPSLLGQLGLPPVEGWLLRVLRRPRGASHSLFHLMVQAFLHLDREQLRAGVHPFGRGPWPCLNRAAPHHGEALISTVEVGYTLNAREPIGTFACSCGFAYRRVGPDHAPEDALRIDRVASYGDVWLAALRRAWPEATLSLRELSRRLGFDPQIVRAQAVKLGLSVERPGSRGGKVPGSRPARPQQETFSGRKQRHWAAWQRVRRDHPDESARGLRSLVPATYTWLYRHDRPWLVDHMPTHLSSQAKQPRIDWAQRDAALSRHLRQAALALRSAVPFVRLTPGRLAREIGQATLLARHLDKLPTCRRALTTLCETREAFALRRIQRVTTGLLESGTRLPRWRLARLAGLRPELLARPDVAQGFEQAWAILEARFEVPAA
ncbi:TnsD family transposase [Deinococcus yunweiensis]|uniref:TnsD family transposase n=1 Tax=Deinococcus yunweiensis TaxID=367282 RepID=UPI00398E77A4